MAKFSSVVKAQGGSTCSNVYRVPVDMIVIRHDSRDRTTKRYFDHFENVYNGIIIAGGVQDTLLGYRGTGEDSDKIILSNGRTRYYAAMKAIADGKISDELKLKIEVTQGSETEHLANEFRSQNSLPLTLQEKATNINNALSLEAGNVAEVAKKYSLTKAKIQQFIDYNALPVAVKNMVEDGSVAFTVALDTAKTLSGNKLVKALKSAADLKKERNASTKTKGKGYKTKNVTKADVYEAQLRDDGVYEETITKQTNFITEAVNLEGISPYVLLKVNTLLEKEVKRLEKEAPTEEPDTELETSDDEEYYDEEE